MRSHGSFEYMLGRGKVSGCTSERKFGASATVGTTQVEIHSLGGNLPWLATATAVRVAAGNAADTAAGAGARLVTVIGVNNAFELTSSSMITDGITASLPSAEEYRRVFRTFVDKCGTDKTAVLGTYGNNVGNVVIENAAGTQNLAQVDAGLGQSLIGSFTVPKGYHVVVYGADLRVQSTRSCTFTMWQQRDAHLTVAPFEPAKVVDRWRDIATDTPVEFRTPLYFPEYTDVWFTGLASVATTDVSVNFDYVLVLNETL